MRELSHRAVLVWRLRMGAAAVAAAFFCGACAAFSPLLAGLLAYALAGLGLPLTLWYFPARFRRARWQAAEEILTLSGVFFLRRRQLPAQRVQYAELRQCPIQRRLGVCTLVLHAAGASLTLGQLELSDGEALWRRFSGRDDHAK